MIRLRDQREPLHPDEPHVHKDGVFFRRHKTGNAVSSSGARGCVEDEGDGVTEGTQEAATGPSDQVAGASSGEATRLLR